MKKDKEKSDERERYLLLADDGGTEAAPEEAEESLKAKTDEEKAEGNTDAATKENTEKARIEADVKEFHELFPGISEKDIPSEVWERVNGGESLAASYALYFIKCVKEADGKTAESEKNAKKAPPKLKGGGSQKMYFTPETVKAMSEAEVRKNYDAIVASMSSWK